jgi:hypothetical protein
MNIEDPKVEAAVLEIVIDRLQARCKRLRAPIDAVIRPGNSLDAVDPLDDSRNLALWLKTKPKKQVWASDRTAWTEWVRVNYPDKMRDDFEYPNDPKEIKKLFYIHDFDRLTPVSYVDPDFEAEVFENSRKYGSPVGPGNELDIPGVVVHTPPSQLRCTPGQLAFATIDALLRSGQLDLAELVLDEPAEVPQ